MRFAILLLIASCISGCAALTAGTPPVAVNLPPPPSFMGECAPSGVKVGDPPNQAFDREHAAFKQCSRRGVQARAWYASLRLRYSKMR